MSLFKSDKEQVELLSKYRELLEQIKESGGDLNLGKIIKGPVDGIFRIKGLDGEEKFIASNPEVKSKEGDLVFYNRSIVLKQAPKELILETDFQQKETKSWKLTTWEEIGGLKSQIDRIRAVIETPFNNPKIYSHFGIEPPKGLLLFGNPGCGKTLIAKAIANSFLQSNPEGFFYVKGPELLNRFVGGTEDNIKEIFNNSRRISKTINKPCVVFIDEAEALLGERGRSMMSSTVVPMFLSEMDGFDTNSPFVILATNRPNDIDSAILREGRIDLKIEIGLPTKDDVKDIFKLYLNKTKHNVKISEVSELAYNSIPNLSGATISSIVKMSVNTAVQKSIKSNKIQDLTFDDIKDSINLIKMSPC